MISRTEAIVLHTRKYSDTSSILTVFSREHGKTGIMVKGARRPKSKFGANVMPLGIVDMCYYYKPGRELHTLSSADAIVSLRTLGASYDHLSIGLSVCEAIMLTQPIAEKNSGLYELLRSTLIVLNDAQHNVYSFFAFFCIHLAEIMGFMLDFSLDEVEDSASKDVYFSFDNGAVLAHVNMPGSHSFRIARSSVEKLATLSMISVMQVDAVTLSVAERREIHHFFVQYFSYHLEKRVIFRAEQMVMGD